MRKDYSGLLLVTLACQLGLVITSMLTTCGHASPLRQLALLVEPLGMTYVVYALSAVVGVGLVEDRVRRAMWHFNILTALVIVAVWGVDILVQVQTTSGCDVTKLSL